MTFKKVFTDLKKTILKADIAALEGSFAFQCCITGDGEGTFYIAYKDGELSVEPYDYKGNDAVFKASAEIYGDILAGKISAAEAVSAGSLVVENNESGCADILTFLSGKSAPAKAEAKTPAKKIPAKKTAAKEAPKAEAKKPAAKTEEAKPAVKTTRKKSGK